MFDSVLSIRTVTATTWELTAPLAWVGTKGDTFVVPEGFVTDFATVPRFLRGVVDDTGSYTPAAVLHDYLIVYLINHTDPLLRITSRDADGIFRRIMKDLGTPWAIRWPMWAAVRWAALFSSRRARGRQFGKDAPMVLLVTLIAAPIIMPSAVGTLISLLFVRLLTWSSPPNRGLNARRDSLAEVTREELS